MPQTAGEAINAPVDSAHGGRTDHEAMLHRGLGVGSIVFMVVAAAAPLGVVAANLPIVIAVSGNIGAPAYFVIATIILALFSVGFTLMSRYVPNAGAFYAYVQAGLGRIPGVGAATLALGSYVVLLIGVDAYAGVAVANALEHYTGALTPWWVWSVAILALVGLLGYRDIELSSKVLGVLLVAETLIVVVLDVGIIAHGGHGGLSLEPFAPSAISTGAPGLGIMFALFGFFGFEATAVFRNEARDPDKTIPRSTYIAVVSIGVFYAFSAWAVIVGAGIGNAVNSAATKPETMVFDLAARYVGPIAQDVMQLLLVTSILACILSFHNVITRYQFTLGGAGVLPRSLGQVSPKHRAPSRSSLMVTVVSLVLIGVVALTRIDPVRQAYTWLSGAATLGIVALMALTCLSVVVFFRRTSHERGLWKTVVAPGLGLIGLLAVLVMVIENLPLLIGNLTAAIVVALLVAVAFVAGTVVALVTRGVR
ncbi:MAG TPA: APC family permease [Pseudonocardia sp.]|uniref:APC family permease n=1 Tax=Pseudonocardia sp. TaxID=60912 RepID=UPI002D0C66C2|nr:APC family permease [Pseudonocardia sp.]HTF47414.1 APC family permease [Pseudonocardia sp.]